MPGIAEYRIKPQRKNSGVLHNDGVVVVVVRSLHLAALSLLAAAGSSRASMTVLYGTEDGFVKRVSSVSGS